MRVCAYAGELATKFVLALAVVDIHYLWCFGSVIVIISTSE